jgi:hypothetical protein
LDFEKSCLKKKNFPLSIHTVSRQGQAVWMDGYDDDSRNKMRYSLSMNGSSPSAQQITNSQRLIAHIVKEINFVESQ